MKVKTLGTYAILIGATTTLAILAYKELLNEGARDSVRKTADSVRRAVNDLESVVQNATGTYVEEDAGESNRAETLRQWSSLGF